MFRLLSSLLNLFFPSRCLACDVVLVRSEKVLCTFCLSTLPQSWEDLRHDEVVAERFWDEFTIANGTALFRFTKESPLQHLIHKIKYDNRYTAMQQLGQYYGSLWKYANVDWQLDAIVPVPLHPNRLKERGYNQSTYLAKGMASILGIPCITNKLKRVLHTATQTKKARCVRRENVRGAFHVTTPFAAKHLLLVDDLVTTGATLKECAHTLLRGGARIVSIAVLAVAV